MGCALPILKIWKYETPCTVCFLFQDDSEQRLKTPIVSGKSFSIKGLAFYETTATQGNLLKGIDNKTVRR